MNAAGQKPIATESTNNYTLILGYVDTILTYTGKANPGSATSEAVWQIQKMAYDGDGNLVTIEYADGNTAFDNVWDDRADYF